MAERTISRLIPKRRTPPSQTWRTFLTNHVQDLVERTRAQLFQEVVSVLHGQVGTAQTAVQGLFTSLKATLSQDFDSLAATLQSKTFADMPSPWLFRVGRLSRLPDSVGATAAPA